MPGSLTVRRRRRVLVLRRRVGDDTVMYKQLMALHVLPLNSQHTAFGESFVAILQDVVSAEHLKNAFRVEGER